MSYGEMGKGLMAALTTLLVVCAIAVPLAIWKLVELVLWIFKHLSWSWA